MSERRILVSGDFNNLSSRHVRFLEQAARHAELTVCLWDDALAACVLGQALEFPLAERRYLLESLRCVSQVVVDEQSADSLPEALLRPGDLWAMRAAENNPARQAFSRASGLALELIPEDSLGEFPLPCEPPTVLRAMAVVTGCYDWLHSGHVRFFEEASAFGDLYVGVGSDRTVRELKGAPHPMFPEGERRYLVQAVRFVTHAFINSGSGWLDAAPDIQRLQPQVFVVNEDGDRQDKRSFCEQRGIRYVVLKRLPKEGLPNRASTELRGF